MLTLAPGTVIGGDFRVESLLARGGMGAVYVGVQLSTHKRRALKLMLDVSLTDPDLRRRFEQEAKVASLVDSEHVVGVVAAGIDPELGFPWIAMELLEGESLEAYAERRGPLPPAEVAALVGQLCHALGAAHAMGIVHRDLKPENVFLARPKLADGRTVVKVLDFGIAKILGEGTSSTRAMGTPLWMSPEQTQVGAAVSPATDVWALGLVVFRLLTGRHYWLSASAENAQAATLLREIVLDPLVPASVRSAALSGVVPPAGFDAWLARALAREPGARFATAREAWSALAPLLGATALAPSELATTLPPSRPDARVVSAQASAPLDAVSRTLPEPASARRKRVVASAVSIVGVGVAALFFATRASAPSPQTGLGHGAAPPSTLERVAVSSASASSASSSSATPPFALAPGQRPLAPPSLPLLSPPRPSAVLPVASVLPLPKAPSSPPPAPSRPDYL